MVFGGEHTVYRSNRIVKPIAHVTARPRNKVTINHVMMCSEGIPVCGRFALESFYPDFESEHWQLTNPEQVLLNFRPRYNIPPGTPILILREDEGRRIGAYYRWWLVPFWAKDPRIGYKMNNARSETAAKKPSFRAAFRQRRCIIPASGFYEWKRDGKTKIPHYIRFRSQEPMGFAGLWETWSPPDGGEELRTCAVLTTGPNELMATIHDRMPVILRPEDFADWLDPDSESDFLQALMRPYEAEEMEAYAVSKEVNNARNDRPELVEAV